MHLRREGAAPVSYRARPTMCVNVNVWRPGPWTAIGRVYSTMSTKALPRQQAVTSFCGWIPRSPCCSSLLCIWSAVSCVAGPLGTVPWRERHRPGSDRPTHTRTGVWRRSGLPCFVAPAEAYAVREARSMTQHTPQAAQCSSRGSCARRAARCNAADARWRRASARPQARSATRTRRRPRG